MKSIDKWALRATGWLADKYKRDRDEARAALRDALEENVKLGQDNARLVGENNGMRLELDGMALERDNANLAAASQDARADAWMEKVKELNEKYATRAEADHLFSELERAQRETDFRFRTKPSSMSVYQQQAEAREAS